MKHFNKLSFIVMMLMTLGSQAQDNNNPWALSFGVNAVDYRTSAGGGHGWADQHFSQLFNVSDNWNILPSVSYIGLARSVGNNLSVGIQGSINKIDKFVVYNTSYPSNSSGMASINPGDLMYYAIDANVKYSFKA